MPRKPIPKELVETRPSVLLDGQPHHPTQGAYAPPPPKRYTPAVHEVIVENIKKGNRPHVAAAMAGIHSNEFYNWMRLGKEGHPSLYQFAIDVDLACGVAEGLAVAALSGEAGFSAMEPELAKWWLERSRADGWSKEAATKVNSMLEEFFKRLENSLPPHIFQMVIAAASGQALPTQQSPALLMNVDDQEDDSE